MSNGVRSNYSMKSNSDNMDLISSSLFSTITPDRDERREKMPDSHHLPNIIENERDALLSLASRSKSHETVRSSSDIIDLHVNTPNKPELIDHAKLVSPPKIGTTATTAASFFDSWNSPRSPDDIESPIPYEQRTDPIRPVNTMTMDILNGRYPFPVTSPVNSDWCHPYRHKENDGTRLKAEKIQPFSNIPSAFRTASWNSESTKLQNWQSSSMDLLANGSFEAPPYRFSGIGNMFSPSPVQSKPILNSQSFELAHHHSNTTNFPVTSMEVPFHRDSWNESCNNRLYAPFNKAESISNSSCPNPRVSGMVPFSGQLPSRRPPPIPANIGYPPSYETFSHGVWDNVNKAQSTAKLTAKSHEQALKNSPNSDLRESATSKPSNQSSNTTKSVRSTSSKAAQAAIASGKTIPSAADEVAFDIRNPPLTPVMPPSKEPICLALCDMNPNDVLLGRGGGTNNQLGNQKYRILVQQFQPIYLLSRRKDKPLIARSIVLIIRNRGGRFLRKDETSSLLYEVGDEKAEAKTSQALREGLDVRANHTKLLIAQKMTNTLLTTGIDQQRDGGFKNDKGPDRDVERTNVRSNPDPYYYHHPYHNPEFGRNPYYEGYRHVYPNHPKSHQEYRNAHYLPPYGPVPPGYHNVFNAPIMRQNDNTPHEFKAYGGFAQSSYTPDATDFQQERSNNGLGQGEFGTRYP